MPSQWGTDWQFASACPPGTVERLQLPNGRDASRGTRPEPFLNGGRASPDLRQASAAPNGAHSRLERRVLEGNAPSHPRDARSADNRQAGSDTRSRGDRDQAPSQMGTQCGRTEAPPPRSLTSVQPMGYRLAVRKRLSPWDMIRQELPNGTDTSRGIRPVGGRRYAAIRAPKLSSRGNGRTKRLAFA